LILSCNTAQTYGTELGRDVPQELGRDVPQELGRDVPQELGRDVLQEEEITVSGELLQFQKVTMHLTFGNK
jgi:hypothetical protein